MPVLPVDEGALACVCVHVCVCMCVGVCIDMIDLDLALVMKFCMHQGWWVLNLANLAKGHCFLLLR